MSDIVERLRIMGNGKLNLANQAADEIEVLHQRIAELENNVEKSLYWNALKDEQIAASQAREQQLRIALRTIRDSHQTGTLWKIAEEALDAVTRERDDLHEASDRNTALDKLSSVTKKFDSLQQRVTELETAIDEQMIVTHLGVFERNDNPKDAINKLMEWSKVVGEYFCKEENKELHQRITQLENLRQSEKDPTSDCPDVLIAKSILSSLIEERDKLRELDKVNISLIKRQTELIDELRKAS